MANKQDPQTTCPNCDLEFDVQVPIPNDWAQDDGWRDLRLDEVKAFHLLDRRDSAQLRELSGRSHVSRGSDLLDLLLEADNLNDFFSTLSSAGWTSEISPGIEHLVIAWHRSRILRAELEGPFGPSSDWLQWLCLCDLRELVITSERLLADAENRMASTVRSWVTDDLAESWPKDELENIAAAAAIRGSHALQRAALAIEDQESSWCVAEGCSPRQRTLLPFVD